MKTSVNRLLATAAKTGIGVSSVAAAASNAMASTAA